MHSANTATGISSATLLTLTGNCRRLFMIPLPLSSRLLYRLYSSMPIAKSSSLNTGEMYRRGCDRFSGMAASAMK